MANKKLLLTIIMLAALQLAYAINADNTATDAEYNTTLSLNIIVWADSTTLNNVAINMTSDDGRISINNPVQTIGTINNGNFAIKTFNIISTSAGSHSLTANITYTGGTYIHTMTINVAGAGAQPDFSLNTDYPTISELNKNFNIIVNLTNNGTATETGIRISAVLPSGATTSYTPASFSLAPGQTRIQTITINSTTTGEKSYIIKADGATQYKEETITIVTGTAALKDIQINNIAVSRTTTGAQTTITADLDNNGLQNQNAIVRLYIDSALQSTQIVNALSGRTQEVTFTYTFATSGSKEINITIDPVAGETNLANNNAYRIVIISLPSSSGGGHHSSGGSSGTIGTVTTSVMKSMNLTANKSVQIIGVNDKLIFKYRGVDHTITLLNLTSAKAYLKIESATTYMNLSVNETKTAPLDNLGDDDISITFTKINLGKAELAIKLINQPTAYENTAEETATAVRPRINETDSRTASVPARETITGNTPEDTGLTIVDLDQKGNKWLIIAILGLSTLLIIAVIFIVILSLRKSGKSVNESKAEKRKKLREKVKALELEIEETNKEIRRVR